MPNNRRLAQHAKELGLAATLGLVFLALSYVRILGDAGSAEFRTKIIDAALAGPVWGTALGNNLVVFGLTQAALHISFALACWALALLSKAAWPATAHSLRTLLLLWFLICIGWVLVANAVYFPWSSLGTPYAESVRAEWHGLSVFTAYTAVLLISIIWTMVNALWRLGNPRVRVFARWLLPATASIVTALALLIVGIPPSASPTSTDKPHIIIIGLDSLRVDAVRRSPATLTPAIDGFLRGSLDFTDTTTPLARTFPAWVSLISGKHPHTTGAVMNLIPRDMIHTGDTLPQLLSRAGYKTIYAIDEVRFSNLDRSYGFDEMVAPPIGATDFLLGFFADAPLSNLIVNSWLGEFLFPYTHANRAAATTYYPDSFVNRLDRILRFEQPTFLATHLTLAHWPFVWADAETSSDAHVTADSTLYYRAVERLDEQFAGLLRVLEKRGALKNAIVIVLSDHGESLGKFEKARETKPSPEFEESKLMGHGTSVFSLHQYHVLFALRSYGETPLSKFAPSKIAAPVSLEDVAPTIIDILAVDSTSKFDGISALSLLAEGSDTSRFHDRIRFTETEFNPPGVMTGQIASTSAMWTAAAYYRVDPVSDRVLIRRERLPEILANRQYAAFRNGKLLAAVPQDPPTGTEYQPFLVIDDRPPVLVPDPSLHPDLEVAELWVALLDRFPSLRESAAPAREREVASR